MEPTTQEVPPDPAAMIESMRAFGYSLPAAVADLVDNSISAEASSVDITFHWSGSDSWILVSDDGLGMDSDELTNAMRLGSRSPREKRDPSDLGRFGLGLKTAAFSQASALTVVSRQDGTPELRSWDLEHVTEAESWSLIFDERRGDEPALESVSNGHRTAVLLRRLDRLVGEVDLEDDHAKDHFLRHIDAVREHLAMVFHRFLSSGLAITVNGHALEPWDPFMRTECATQRLPAERLPFDGELIEVRPNVLPHHSRLTAEKHSAASGPRGWNQHQGFYVYRAKRLLVSGDWLGLPVQKEEHFKLARIQVDLTNSMDLAWQIDVRKATARIPRPLKDELRRIATATRARASEAYRYRGKRVARSANVDQTFVWTRRVNRGTVSYRIDLKHPLIAEAIRESGDAGQTLKRALRIVEETLPTESIMIDSSESPDSSREPFAGSTKELAGMLRSAYDAMIGHGGRSADSIALLARIEPFSSHPELVASLEETISHAG